MASSARVRLAKLGQPVESTKPTSPVTPWKRYELSRHVSSSVRVDA